MNIAIVRSTFWGSAIVQHLRTICPEEVTFRQSENVRADILFPFCGAVSFSIVYPDHMNSNGIREIEAACKIHPTLVVIACISHDESIMYGDFLSAIPVSVSTVICLPPDAFTRKSASFIWDIATKAKPMRRKIDRLIEEQRTILMDPDLQGARVLGAFITDAQERDKLLHLMSTETGTIRATLVQGIHELLERDFFIQDE